MELSLAFDDEPLEEVAIDASSLGKVTDPELLDSIDELPPLLDDNPPEAPDAKRLEKLMLSFRLLAQKVTLTFGRLRFFKEKFIKMLFFVIFMGNKTYRLMKCS